MVPCQRKSRRAAFCAITPASSAWIPIQSSTNTIRPGQVRDDDGDGLIYQKLLPRSPHWNRAHLYQLLCQFDGLKPLGLWMKIQANRLPRPRRIAARDSD